ncbi:MAG: ABC transporter [Candidatus Dactylopiibacterium carminicum]|uniref:ABC transporter n=1 Tax=Candidatus Dactylopiibacterium carminicum TaxID=857335 RepID=A0A272ERP8_9RHOO|nr:ABC transporter permease [Candidatus Dactylopiibacterium carminicum]KAF7598828.1 ABC transporter [Candidatus Dactylopiibacterium carminicum]PAS92716.1 MAG: ABC transporter [Candidatus Dactylopiibacterium carminicum]PAS98848.1 MAG: ABC transporter [Candidatus Dactylopiibacterium carminicum]
MDATDSVGAAGRHPLRVTLSVWYALLLRESLTRLFSRRAAWAWLMAEPLFHIAYMLAIFTGIRAYKMGGVDVAIWLITGMCAFFMFRRVASQGQNAISANQALFSYRQVLPVDTVIVRALLEGVLMLLVTCVLLAGAALFGHDVVPDEPLLVIGAAFGLWLIGLGWGLITSVLCGLVAEVGNLIGFLMLLSGAIMPINSIPQPYRDYLILNPLVHGIDAVRLGFAPYYHAIPELSLPLLYAWALGMLALGLILQVHYRERLMHQ